MGAVAAHIADTIIRLIDFLHLLFRNVRERTVVIIIGMIFFRQITISGFDFVVGSGLGHAEYFIRIFHLILRFFGISVFVDDLLLNIHTGYAQHIFYDTVVSAFVQ